MTVRVSFVRHGETVWNVDRRLLGWNDLPLDPVGERRARDLGAAVDIGRYTAVWCSDLDRAAATARLAGWQATSDRRLRELDFGELEGRTWAELDPETRAGLVAFEGYTPPGGESVTSFVARVVEFLDSLPPGAHMVVTHGGVIRAALRACGEMGAFPGHGIIYTVDWTRRQALDVQTPTT